MKTFSTLELPIYNLISISATPLSVAESKPDAEFLVELIKVLGPWGAAILAGIFALYQMHRRNKFELQLSERERESKRKDRDLEDAKALADRERQRNLNFRLDRLQPFMDALNQTLVHSYPAMLAPQIYSEVIGYVPILRRYEGRSLQEWARAAERMSDLRMQVILSISYEDVSEFIENLQEYTELSAQLIKERESFYLGHSSMKDIADIHRSYVAKGFELMLTVKEALLHDTDRHPPISEDKDELARKLALPLERASQVSIQFGSQRTCAWVGLWHCNAETAIFELGEGGPEILDEQMRQIAGALHNDLSTSLKVSLVKAGSAGDIKYIISVIFGKQENLDEFVQKILPEVKKQTSEIWTGYLTPNEFIVEDSNKSDGFV